MTLTRTVVTCLTGLLTVAGISGCRLPPLAPNRPVVQGYHQPAPLRSADIDKASARTTTPQVERNDERAMLLGEASQGTPANETWNRPTDLARGTQTDGHAAGRIETEREVGEPSFARQTAFESESAGGVAFRSKTRSQPVRSEVIESLPIDLPTALQLAGADNWNIKISNEKTREAQSRFLAAKSMWLPSLNFGLGYNHHEGEIQATPGQVIETSRGSLFVGGGAVLSQAPLTAGSGGPARMFLDLSVADAIFEPLFQRQRVKAARSGESAVFNDVMLSAGSAYYELVRSQLSLDIAKRDVADAEDVLAMTESFVAAGKGSPADLSRLKVLVVQRQQVLAEAHAALSIAGSQLATVLQLDPDQLNPLAGLTPLDQTPTTISLFPLEVDLSQLVRQAVAGRPEVCQLQAEVAASATRVQGEHWRPWLPSVHVGGSGGGFGGGLGSDLPKLDGRADVDVIVAWQLKNLGVGTAADRRQRASQLNQANMLLAQLKDAVAAEVTQAYHELQARSVQVDLAESNILNAEDAMQKTITRIRGLQGDPLELIQSLGGLASSRRDYANATVDFNVAQLKLLRAVGSSAQDQL